jgi:FtsP/CotA-like multicopper oxidase with cupredoxin domain
MDDPELGVQPGQSRQHEYAIRSDHPPGAYWYHPHLHGATAIQLGSGMAGALLIKGAIDRIPEIAAAFERVFMFQAPVSNAQGFLESFTQ